MTGPVNGNGHEPAIEQPVVVRVRDAINPTLAGRGDASYQSPPQSREQALTLVRLLVGRPGETLTERASWACPIAGGRRTVTIEPAGIDRTTEALPHRAATPRVWAGDVDRGSRR
jgi:hypothetical protein